MIIRVIDYSIDDGRGDAGPYRLFTTLLDPVEAPAAELAFAYAQRWEIELAFDELKTHQRGTKAVLRSKSPALVEQEIWGHLCCHYAIRTLMFEAAHHADVDPDRVSFVAALRHRSPLHRTGARFSPSEPLTTAGRHAIVLLLPPSQPDPTAPLQPAADQTQDAQVARQTRPTRRLAPTHRTTRHHHPPHLTERHWG